MNVVDYSGPVPTQPGSVVRSVPLDRALVDADFPQVHDARRFLYSSTDNDGNATPSTAADFVPPGSPPAGGWPVVAWAHGTVGIGDDCTPSAHSLNPGFPEDTAVLNSLLGQGYAIVATDKGTVSIAGSANLEYLLPFLGPGVPPINLSVLNPSLDIALTLVGFRSFYPNIDLDAYLSPVGRDLLALAEDYCFSSLNEVGDYQNVVIGDMFVRPLAEIPRIVELLRDYQGSPVSGFERPIRLIQGLMDKDVPVTFSNIATAPDIRARGQQVDVRVYPTYDHGATIANAAPDVLDFLNPLYR